MKSRRIIPFVAWSALITTGLILARQGTIPAWVFYTLLIVMHIWIFTRIGIRIYSFTKKKS